MKSVNRTRLTVDGTRTNVTSYIKERLVICNEEDTDGRASDNWYM